MNNNTKVMVEEEEEEKWSQLPILLIWMIKDKLNFGDSNRVGFVCKNWKAASLNYPSIPRQQCIGPWLMHRNWDSCDCEFVNIATKESLIFDFPELAFDHELLFSRRGWLLLRRYYHGRAKSVVLFKPLTKAKITLPDPGGCIGSLASFSSLEDNDSTPQYVVFETIIRNCITFYLSDVNDKTWTIQSYQNGKRIDSTASLLVRGHKVYCLELFGGLFIYDIVNLVWKEVPENTELRKCPFIYRWNIMESEEGDIVMIDCHDAKFETFSFYKFDDNKCAWDELMDVDSRSWYLHDRNNHFTVRKTGVKNVYKLYNGSNIYKPTVDIHDLNNGSLQFYDPQEDGEWVDLGWMDKVPPCKRYVAPPY